MKLCNVRNKRVKDTKEPLLGNEVQWWIGFEFELTVLRIYYTLQLIYVITNMTVHALVIFGVIRLKGTCLTISKNEYLTFAALISKTGLREKGVSTDTFVIKLC